MLSEDQKRILGYFIEEAKDHLNTIEQGLLNLQATIEDTEMVNEVFRAAHSVKGGAAMLGLSSIQRTSHRLEDFFKLMKETPPQADRELESMLLSIFDGLQEQLDQLQGPYGLSDEQAQEILSGLEPIFTKAEAHLLNLLETAPASPQPAPALPFREVPAEVAVSHSETSALQLVFQSDVPALLRDMLATFKKADTAVTRQELIQICQRLKSIGEQFEIHPWNELLGLISAVVANSQQTFRTLASIIIKDLKRAQELVLAGNASQICASLDLQAMVPADSSALNPDESILDAMLAEALNEESTDESDLADLFAVAEEEGAISDGEESDDSWLDQVPQTDVSDVDDLEAAFDSLTAEALGTDSAGTRNRQVGVEVGDAELNSLADLFEGDPADLEAAWQEEVVAPLPTENKDQENELDLESDLADLLGTTESAETLSSEEEDEDLTSLFGESFDAALAAAGLEVAAADVADKTSNASDLLSFSEGAELPEPISTAETEDNLDEFFSVKSDEKELNQVSDQTTATDIDDFFEAALDETTPAAIGRSTSQLDESLTKGPGEKMTTGPAEIATDADQASMVDDLNLEFPEETAAATDFGFGDFDLDVAEASETDTASNLDELDWEFPQDTEAFSESRLDELDQDFDELADETELGAATVVTDLDFGIEELRPKDTATSSSNFDDLDLGEDIWNEDSPVTNAAAQELDVAQDKNQSHGENLLLKEDAPEADTVTTTDSEEVNSSLEYSDHENEGVTQSDFDRRENLLDDSPAAEPDASILVESQDSFDDLEALLGEDSFTPTAMESLTPIAVETAEAEEDDLDEFSDLEKLLEDTDQLGGSSPSLTKRRAGAVQSTRRPLRRTSTVNDQTMRVSVSHLDILSNLVGELVVNRNSLEQDQDRLRQFLDNLLGQVQQLNDVGQRMRDLYERSLLESSLISSRQALVTNGTSNGSDSHATGATFDALEMDRFTGFHTLSQEMIELIVRVREAASDIEFTIDSSDQITRQFRQVTTQLQEGLNKARMVPFGQTADRLPRAVRDISLKCGKEARLVVEGRDTLIDKMILERLYDPVTHLVNNAITHGIESPSERESRGKSRQGTITIRAFYQGNQTVIYIADDGGGINPDVVKAKALERGLISPAEAESMSDVEVYDLLFLPGFSTRDQADDFSGRGVGMDVVRTALADIRGAITIESNLDKGTSFTIRLPLTLSITKALSCVNNQARIAFPMDGVEDMFDAPQDRIQTNEQGMSCILWRDTLLPFRPLSELMQFSRSLGRGRVYGGSGDDNTISIVVLRSASTFIGLQVDQVMGEQEIVIKQLEGPVPKPTGIAGATVMGDGRVMPIADVLELVDLSTGRVRWEPASSLWSQNEEDQEATQAVDREEPTVLIVDDSITVRELLSMSFNKVGYRVEQARDGQEAWEKLRSGLPCDLVFCDIEMPRMDGLELLSRLQKDEQLSQIPIAMLTSRGADRHRQMAVELGASGYFTKPYLEEMLLDAAQRMLNGESMINVKTEAQSQEA